MSYTEIADALEEEGEAMGLDRMTVFHLGTRLIEALDEPDSKRTHYPLNHVIGTVLTAASRAGIGLPAASELAVRMTRRLGGEEEGANPIVIPRGDVLLALTEECVALRIEAMTMAMLAGGVTRRLAGEAAAREFMDGVIESMKAKEEGREMVPPRRTPETVHELEKEVAGAIIEEGMNAGLDLTTIFVLGKHVVYRLGGKAALDRYVEKITALMEMTQALQKLDKACR